MFVWHTRVFAIKVPCLTVLHYAFSCSLQVSVGWLAEIPPAMLKRQYLAEQEPLLRRSGVVSSSTTSPTSEEETTNNPHDLTAEEKVTEKRLIRKLDLNLLLWAQVFHFLWMNAESRFSWLKRIQIPGVLGEWVGSKQHAYVNCSWHGERDNRKLTLLHNAKRMRIQLVRLMIQYPGALYSTPFNRYEGRFRSA